MSKDPNLLRNRLAPVTTTSRRGSFGLPGSLLLHAAIIGGALFTWQHHYTFPDVSPPVVPVELVTIADKTNIKQVAPEPAFKPKPEQPIEAQQPVDTPPPLPQHMDAPSVPIPVEPEPQIAAATPKLDAKAPKIEMQAPPPPKVVPRQRPEPPKPAEKKKEQFNVNSVLALLDKSQPTSSTARGTTGAQPHRGFGAQNAMTMELGDALRNQIAQCWSPPVAAPHPADLIVDFELFLNPDGSVARPPQLAANSAAAASGNPFTRAAAEAARRAIYECAPYKLPANRYSDWRDITLEFDPRQMMGGQ